MIDNSDEKTMGMLAHLLGIFTGFVGPLVIFLIRQEKKGIGFENAKNALNFQITIVIGFFIATVSEALFSQIPFLGFIGTSVWIGVLAISIIFGIQGTMSANEGKVYKYSITLTLIK